MADFTPHSYQRPAMQWLYEKPRCALWMPMGGGKTVTTLTSLDNLSMVEDVYPVLVLAPLRVAKTTWPDEIGKWEHLKHLRVSPIVGNAKERQAALDVDADIYTMNYDNLVWLQAALGTNWPFKTVVADEFTRLKSFRLRQGSKRAAALARVAHTKVSRFIGLTGTPNPNGLQDLWGQTWFLDGGERLGKTFSAFSDRWFAKGWDGYNLKPLASAQKEIEDRLRDVCLTVEGLPVHEPVRNYISVDLPAKARRVYDSMENDMFAELEETGIEAFNAAAKTIKCLQLANGAVYTDDAGNWEEVHDAKLDALDSVIEEANGAPVMVAYHFKSDLARLQSRYPKGRVLDAKSDTIRDWNAGRTPLLFAHPASAGHGLNLAEGGNILVFFSLNWNLEEHLQIIERIGPMRQAQAGLKRPVFVHYIMARNTVDNMVLGRLQSKKSVQEILLEALKRKNHESD
jgi:SNF2 family DNA or RNA helicase